ncbi:hypothetical protein HUO13_10745 [Saccharopolyspora erythraea]|uniref:hypothetical protein n=1 Tax=Saccharopolyspora erythraea TaxID=1836 RepID=UPI001BAC1FF6|nr:hypothetical protein [Saccharopolyspora erythraea]QUH05917.1 hypothetical protein HUO13_10745 [Saccharopolyspora erythraea]
MQPQPPHGQNPQQQGQYGAPGQYPPQFQAGQQFPAAPQGQQDQYGQQGQYVQQGQYGQQFQAGPQVPGMAGTARPAGGATAYLAGVLGILVALVSLGSTVYGMVTIGFSDYASIVGFVLVLPLVELVVALAGFVLLCLVKTPVGRWLLVGAWSLLLLYQTYGVIRTLVEYGTEPLGSPSYLVPVAIRTLVLVGALVFALLPATGRFLAAAKLKKQQPVQTWAPQPPYPQQ